MATHAGRAVFEQGIDDPRGNAQRGVLVTVYLRGTNDLATLYTDRTKAVLADNPITTNGLGNVGIFADPGDYDAHVGGAILKFSVLPDWEDVVLGTSPEAGLPAHLADGTDAHDASAVSFTPAGGIAATNAQDAVVEVLADAVGLVDAEAGIRAAADAALQADVDSKEPAIAPGTYVPATGASTIAGLKDFTTAPTVNGSPIAGTVPDATSGVKGKVQLAGDLAGTAATPTVPGLALKLDIAAAVPLSSDLPLALGTANAGATNAASRSDHVHPSTGFVQTVADVTTLLGTTVSKNVAGQTANAFETRDVSNGVLAFINTAATRFRLAKMTGKTFGPSLENDVTNRIFDIDLNGQAAGVDTSLGGGFIRIREGDFSVFSHPAGTGSNDERFKVRPKTVGGVEVNTYMVMRNQDGGGLLFQGLTPDALSQVFRVQDWGMAVGVVPNSVSSPATSLDVYPESAGREAMLVKGITGQTADRVQYEDASNAVSFAITAACLPKWTKAANTQTTVGAAGAASAVPATPTRYLKVVDSDGTVLVVPAFLAS